MADSVDILKKLAQQVRNATQEGENTAERVGRVLVGILENLSQYDIDKLSEYFLRKDQSDGTSFLLKLLGGAEFGNFASGISGANIDAQGAAELLSLVLRGALTIGEYKKGLKGANIDEQGAADLLSILVRDGMESANFSTGALGAGFCLKKDENGDSYLEVDRMLVRKVATFIQLLIQQIKHVGGQIILTLASMSCIKVEDMGNYYRCYFENTDGEKTIEQEFVVGDLARAQTFNVKEGVNENVTNTYYWRAVVGVGDNYIDLSKTDCDAGSTEPKAGDDIVQLGNKTDATRQAAIILSAYGNDAPYFKLYRGINSYSLDGKEFVSFSRSEVMIIADTIRFSSGESLKDYIDGAVGDVNSKVDKTISDLSENISFVNQLSKDLESVKNQVDGAIETWFYDPVPTLSNEPAVNWTTDGDKNVHLGDLYYDGNGKAYRFQMEGSSYIWKVITDSDITKALADAKAAQDTADGKRRVFVTTPTNSSAYDVGDLWVNATYGSYKNDLLRCKTSKQANVQFSIEHWELASKYTDDTKANQAIEDAANAKVAADNAQSDADEAKSRLDSWASDGSISPTEKQSLKEEIARIDADKTQIANGYTKYSLGTPTAYNNAYTAYRAVLITLTASSPETITIPSDFSTKQTTYYTQRTTALTAISNAARDYAQGIANDLSSYKKTVSSQFEQTNNSITAAVTSSKEYTDSAVGEVNSSLTEYKKEVTSQFSVLEGEINSKVSSTEITTIKQEIINTAASDATKKANDAKTSAISTASADATSKANKAKQDAISIAATDATNKANQAKNDAITTAGQNADKKYATITTVSSMQTSITQLSNSLSLKAEKSEVTAVQNNLNQTNNNLSALTTRVSKAEVALQPDNIWIGISSKVTSVSKITNIVPDSCFDDANYSLLYTGGSRVSSATANNSCPTSYCMKSTQRDVQGINYVAVTEGEKYYISAYVNASLANYEVGIGLLLKTASGGNNWIRASFLGAKTTGWQKVSGYITIPAGYIKAAIWFQINGSSNFGSAYFTKVYAYKVDSNRNNLALNSKGPWTANKYQLVTYLTFVAPLKSGTIYTVSWKGSGTGNLAVYFSNGAASSARQGVSNGIPVTANSNYQGITFYSEHFKLDPSLGTDNGINLTVSEVKVEEGERATDWCYSEGDYSTTEEIKAGISITENTITILGKAISLQGKITFSSLNSSLQSTINGKADSSDITSSKDDIAKKLGYSSYSDMVNKASAGNTIINGGYIRTSLIDTNTLVAKTLNAINDGGINTLVNKDGITMSKEGTELLTISSWEKNQYLPQIKMRYDDATTEISSVSLSMKYGNSNAIHLSANGLQLTFKDGITVLARPRIIWCGYITSYGAISYQYGNYLSVSVKKNSTGTYTVTHNIGRSSYYPFVNPILGGFICVSQINTMTSNSFVYTTANANDGVQKVVDAPCMVMIVYNPSLIYDA